MAANDVTFCGNLGADPELRFTPSGTAVANFSVAVKEYRSDRDEDEVHWFDVTAWKTLAENVAESLRKGDRVLVSGQLKQDKWQNEVGENRSKVSVTAWNVGPDLTWHRASPTRVEDNSGPAGGHSPPEPTPSVPF